MHARRRHIGVRGGIFNEGHIGHGGAAAHGAFQQVMAQHLPFGQTARQDRMHGLHMEQALAGERALTKEVLVNLGRGGAVGVNAALPGKQPAVGRGVLGVWQGGGHMWLQDAVAAHHRAPGGVQLRLVVRVRRHPDQLTQLPGR